MDLTKQMEQDTCTAASDLLIREHTHANVHLYYRGYQIVCVTICMAYQLSIKRPLPVPELQGDGAFDVVEMDVVSIPVLHHLLQSAV